MADDERPAVGSVAQEAARLLDALGGWASSTQAAYAAGPAHEPASPDESGPDVNGPPEGGPGEQGRDSSAADPGSHQSRCESCGAENGMGQAVTCQLCPVCQGLGLLRSVRPETVDRLADLAGALAATLRDIAGQRRADAGVPTTKKPSGPAARGKVHDITIEDEDQHPSTKGSATS